MVEDFQSWLESYDLEKLFSDKRDKETIDKEMFLFVRSNDFDNYFSFDGELGALYENEGTLLRVWTPTAKSVEVWTYTDESIKKPSQKIAMVQKPKGIFEAYLPGDQHGTIYVYNILFLNNRETITVDPYARATTVNGTKSVITDLLGRILTGGGSGCLRSVSRKRQSSTSCTSGIFPYPKRAG